MTSINSNFSNQNLFQKLDTNNDGKVSFKEIKDLFNKESANTENSQNNNSINTEDKPSVENYKAHESEANTFEFEPTSTSKSNTTDSFKDIAKNEAFRSVLSDILDSDDNFCIEYKELSAISESQKNKIINNARESGVSEKDIQSFFDSVESLKNDPPKDSKGNIVEKHKVITWQDTINDKSNIESFEDDIKKGGNNFNKNKFLKKIENEDLRNQVGTLLDKISTDKDISKNEPTAKQSGHFIEKYLTENENPNPEVITSLLNYLNTDASPNALVSNEQKINYVKDLLHDISYPTDIDQGRKGTCAATAVQVQLALEDPKKYVDMALSLGDGKSWDGIKPNATYKADENDQRSLSAKIIQNSFMDFAAPVNWNSVYSGDGAQGIAANDDKGRGLYSNEVIKLQEEVFDVNSDLVKANPNSKDKIINTIDSVLNEEGHVQFSFAGHAMLVLDKDAENYTIFTWGGERKISHEDFEHFLVDAKILNG